MTAMESGGEIPMPPPRIPEWDHYPVAIFEGGPVPRLNGPSAQHSATPSGENDRPVRLIPLPRNEDIVDRAHISGRLETLLPSTSEYQSAALCGLGGSGKTQVALEYAYRRSRDPACSVFWVHADNKATFSHDYKAIAERLDVRGFEGEDLLLTIRKRIETSNSWVLILDNADDLSLFGVGVSHPNTSSERDAESESLFDYVPSCGNGTVLWTSRDERIIGTLVGPRRGIPVGQMSSSEARNLLGKWRNKDIGSEETEDADKLLGELRWLPLAISQAGAYLRRTETPIHEYLSSLSSGKERWRLLRITEFDRHRRLNVPNSVLETWNISIERIRLENEIAYNILHTIAFFNNQDIPLELISAAGLIVQDVAGKQETDDDNPEGTNGRVLEAITRLKEFSFLGLVQKGDRSRSYEIHKLVQEATRHGLSLRGPQDEAFYCGSAMRILRNKFPEPRWDSPETLATCERYVAHALEIGKFAEIAGVPTEFAALFCDVSEYLEISGRWKEMEIPNTRAYGYLKQVFGDNDPRTIKSMENLASTLQNLGRSREAESLELKVGELLRKMLGNEHPDALNSMMNLASIYRDQGRYAEAEAIQVRVLESRQRTLSEKAADTLASLQKLSETISEQGRYTEAEAIETKVYHLNREMLGERHPLTLDSMEQVATTSYMLSRYMEAEKLERKILQLRKEVQGPRHPDVLRCMANLAVTLDRQGQLGEAEALQREALHLRQECLGERHPETVASLHGVALTLCSQGRLDEAEDMMSKALELRREIQGEKHPDTLRTMSAFARVLSQKRRYHEAEPIHWRALQLLREALGDNNYFTLETMDDLAITWYSLGRHEDAIKLLEECHRRVSAALSPDEELTMLVAQRLNRWKTRCESSTAGKKNEMEWADQSLA